MQKLESFLDPQGRLKALPARQKVRLLALAHLASAFQKGRVYTEREVNALLDSRHTFGDPVTLRRELYDHGLLGRSPSGDAYWLESPAAEAAEAAEAGPENG